MIGALKRSWANFRGFDLTGSTVPPMDGPLRPNAALDAAPLLLKLDAIDNLTLTDTGVIGSVGAEIHTFADESGALRVASSRSMPGIVTAIAASGARLAIAVEGVGLVIEMPGAAPRTIRPEGLNPDCVTALSFGVDGKLHVAVGSRGHAMRDWKRDLMTKAASGSVLSVDIGSGTASVIAQDLAFPSGILAADGRVYVSEAWRHRVVAIGAGRDKAETVLGALPAYPGRIAAAASGGYWLAMFAPRNPLVEFVLKEDEYRRRMIETIPQDYWIAPSLLTGGSFLEPIQGGARKKLNMLKPWSPTWSTGLVVRCDGTMAMLRSYHSRADGTVHGVMSLVEAGGRLLVGAKGSGKIVAIDEMQEKAA